MKPRATVRRAGIRLPSTEGLRAFEAVARLGSFERAAQELNLTASAVSKRVSALDELTGTPLFVRKPNSLRLTEFGVAYAERVREVLGLLIAMPRHEAGREATGHLRITSTPTFARQVLAPNLSAFAAAHPGIAIELTVVPPVFDYPGTNADVEIRAGDASAHEGIPLMQDVITPMASPHLLPTLPRIESPQDLRNAQIIRTPLEPWLPWFRAAKLDWPEPVGGPKLLDLGLAFEAAVNSHGVALCRPSLVRDWLARGALVPLFDIFVRPAKQYYVLANVNDPAIAAFVLWLQDLCAEAAEAGVRLARDGLKLRCGTTLAGTR
jgi:LysR family transcriptional regulator, glycine cleavage system transcriptional activator